MTDSLMWAWLRFVLFTRQVKEDLKYKSGQMLPRWLVRRAAIRMIVHASSGTFASTDVTDVRAMTVLRRWDESNG